jgi:hypothetical protein
MTKQINSAIASIAMAIVLSLAGPVIGGPWDTVLFRDDFDGAGINGDDWVINNPNSDWWQPLGRTFFPNPTNHIGDPYPHIENNACVIEFHKHNHRHLGNPKTTFLSGEIHTVQQFDPDKDYRFEARVKSNASPGGLVTSFFLYGYDGARADEIDFEFVSNKTNDNTTYPLGDPVLTNTWDESLELPQYSTIDGMDLSQWNTFRIYWYPAAQRVEWTWMDPAAGETLLRTETNAIRIPDEPMSLYFNFWAPSASWTDAYDPLLQPAQTPAEDETFTYEIDYTEVRITSVPGDTNADRIVDDTDYNNLIAQLGAAPPEGSASADFNGDNIVDLADFIIMRENFGYGVAAPTSPLNGNVSAAPEPIASIMLVAAVPFLLKRKRSAKRNSQSNDNCV